MVGFRYDADRMDAAALSNPPPARTLACARCRAAFNCNPGGECWCADESFRLPLPASGAEDCLCPDCLRALARSQGATQSQA
jgi:hypothetical protein